MINPDDPTAYRKRGDAHRQRLFPNLDRAIADYEAALARSPDDPATLCSRGTMWVDLGDFDAAVVDFQRAHEIDRENPRPLNNLGYVAAAKGDLDEAISYFSRAIEVSPKHAFSYANRGFAHLEQGKLRRALRDLDMAVDLGPATEITPLVDRGDTKAALGDLQGAVADYSRAIELNSRGAGFAGAFFKRSEAYARSGENSKAAEDLKRAQEYGDHWRKRW